MKNFKSFWIAGFLLSALFFISCTASVSPQDPSLPETPTETEKEVTVTFFITNNEKKTVTLKAGSSIPVSKIPTDRDFPLYNYLMFWSESKESLEKVKEFDLKSKITEDKTLYAIFTPELAYESIQNISSIDIEIKLYSTYVYPLEDGTYVGLKFQHSTDDTNYTDIDLKAPYETEDKNGYRYLKFYLNFDLPEGNNYFKVSNGYQSHTKSIDYVRPENLRTVTFDDNGTILKKIELKVGENIPPSEIPQTSYKSWNDFLHWSAYKISKQQASAFDFYSPITKNTTLYAIYAPRICSISTITKDYIEIQLYDTNVFPLDDGSYAGIIITYALDNGYYDELSLNPPSYEDRGGYRYLKYYFNETLGIGTHHFRVSNDRDTTKTKDLIIAAPAPVTNLSAMPEDCQATISFTTAENWTSYTVKVYDGSSEITSRPVRTGSNPDTVTLEIYGLKNGTEYTVKVLTDETDKYAETTVSPAITKKETDWLVAMYMDGDNNLHEPIWLDLNEVEYGLYSIRNSDGTPKTIYDEVTAVALWDGAVSWEGVDKNGNDTIFEPQIGTTGSCLFELGTDSSTATANNTSGNKLSSNTKNLSYTAPWIVGEDSTVTYRKPTSSGEVNMGDKETLINFLNWVNAHYTARKGIILQFSDHGGGPRSVRYINTANGTSIKLGDTSGRRALCWDESSSSNFLKTKDVSEALEAARFGRDNQLSIILMDVCLGSSLEDAYQFKDYAKYLAASPNTIPGTGLDYVKLMKSFKTADDLETITKTILEDYQSQYHSFNINLWNNYAQSAFGKSYALLTDSQKEVLEWAGELGQTTFTITDLSKIDDVKKAINELCDILLSEEGKDKEIYVDSEGVFSQVITENKKNYVKYLGDHLVNVVNVLNGKEGYYINDSIYYPGSFTWLYDIGYIADRIRALTAANFLGSVNENYWPELNTAANALSEKLNQAIKYSWRDSGLNSSLYNYDFYYSIDGNYRYNHHYGLTICGANLASDGDKAINGSAPDFYKTDLAFGKDSRWGDLLDYWFEE